MITKEQKDYIIKLLQDGKEIPEEFKYQLFPTTQKEYELAYAGKIRKEDLLANEDGVLPVPLQIEKVFNGSEYKAFDDGWRNMITFGDNLQFLKTIYENKDPLIKDKVKGKVKLIYIDPPFATTDDFQNKEGAKAYTDKKKGAEFVEFLRKRLIMAKEILAPDGLICVHLDQKMNHYIKILLDEIFLKNRFQNEIIWHYSTLGRPKDKFAKKHDNILVYAKSDNSFFNINEAKVPYSEEYIKSHFKDTDDKGNQCRKRYDAGKWRTYYPEEGMIPNDVWEIPYENSMSTDRTGYPTQKPEPLIERFVKAYTKENDIVLDFFGGSGTTIAVAEKLNRKWITCDLGKLSYFTMQKRILQIQNSKSLGNPKKKYGAKAKSFITASLGSYDLEKTFELERKQYVDFVSGLFKIEAKKYKISGFELEGKKNDAPVIIFDYKKHKDSSVDENYLNNIHKHIGKKVGSRVYIVAPINFIDFVDDFMEIDDVRYYFLKIPYHIINELHKKPFVKMRQPQSKSRVNNIEEVVGFHFKRPPEVKAEIQRNESQVKIVITSFKTAELRSDRTKEEKSFDNFETLSAVFIDKNYNGKSFEMDESLFADDLLPKKPKQEEALIEYLKDLTKTGIEIPLKSKEIGKQVMVVFTDIFGNDFTQTFTI
ncbi:site-specific DNA-methyltransferase [Sulfurimonas sp.]|uniref:DNA methyltransferase n=1 Tax=Sulfurimonas sp. TaxID=2022749 RepID=UPI0025EE6454|nr:site-specific DNA-methyltransferase [Sulfurimonas sp.]